MKAAFLKTKAGPESFVFGELPLPELKAGEVLVKVHASAITPTELQWVPTFTARSGAPRAFPIVLGHEFSGVIEALRGNVGDFQVGDAVYGLNDWFINGSQAEYCAAASSTIAAKPRSLDHVHAASVPISVLTAWQALIIRGKLWHRERLLIHGAAGAVGIFAVQIARDRGAHVIATASAANHDFVESLGADEVIDYHTTRFDDVVRDVDLVFDTVGGETLERSWKVLKSGGRMVTIAAQSERTTDQRVRDAFMLMEANGAQLAEIANVIDAGRRQAFVAAEYPLEQVREAYANAMRGGGRGKTVLRPMS